MFDMHGNVAEWLWDGTEIGFSGIDDDTRNGRVSGDETTAYAAGGRLTDPPNGVHALSKQNLAADSVQTLVGVRLVRTLHDAPCGLDCDPIGSQYLPIQQIDALTRTGSDETERDKIEFEFRWRIRLDTHVSGLRIPVRARPQGTSHVAVTAPSTLSFPLSSGRRTAG